ncbi:MAG: CPBP family intramembrane metalloprotease [Clostridiales bacterium]|nr:CPBP family intramembrane metalloprotease [Clostridiales bacterium]
MSSLKEKILRTPRTWTDVAPLTLFLGFVLFYLGAILASFTGFLNVVKLFTADPDAQDLMADYAIFTGIWVVFIPLFIIFKGNRPILKEFIPDKKSKIIKGLLIGGVIGFVMNSISVGGAFLMGDLKFSYNGIEILPLVGFILFVFIQSGAEEILNRCYVYQKLRRRYKSPLVAIIANSLLFMAMHLGNDNIKPAALIDITIWGVLFSLIIYYYDNLWACMAIHAAWNFTQNIIYGLPNSGIVSKFSILKLEAASDGFFFDTGFGVEGCWGTVVVGLLVIALLIFINRKKECNDLWANWERPASKKKAETT